MFVLSFYLRKKRHPTLEINGIGEINHSNIERRSSSIRVHQAAIINPKQGRRPEAVVFKLFYTCTYTPTNRQRKGIERQGDRGKEKERNNTTDWAVVIRDTKKKPRQNHTERAAPPRLSLCLCPCLFLSLCLSLHASSALSRCLSLCLCLSLSASRCIHLSLSPSLSLWQREGKRKRDCECRLEGRGCLMRAARGES